MTAGSESSGARPAMPEWGISIAHTHGLRDRIAANLGRHRRRVHELGERRHAAVAIVVVDADRVAGAEGPGSMPADTGDERLAGVDGLAAGASLLLCRRSAGLNRHASQWALPGGRVDAGESVVDAARRELHEELGLDVPADAVLGLLDDYPSRSGYVITPVVLWVDGDVELRPNAAEVHAAYRIGLHELCRPDSPRFVAIPESERPVVQVPIGRALIHAPTGAVLVQLRWLGLDGHDDPVDGFEQPVFAWR